MEHPYEYMMLCDYFHHPGGGTRIFDFKDEQNRQSFCNELDKRVNKMINALPDNNGWEVNSHSITLIEDVWLTTILIQRRST